MPGSIEGFQSAIDQSASSSRFPRWTGDLFLCFSSHNRVPRGRAIHPVEMMDPESMTPLFEAAVEATEEAILNALAMADTMSGREGRIAHALPLDRVADIVAAHRVQVKSR